MHNLNNFVHDNTDFVMLKQENRFFGEATAVGITNNNNNNNN